MRTTTREDYQRRLARALDYIVANLDGDLELAAVARAAHFSPYHFHRIFRGLTGESVAGLVRRLRMARAGHRLRHHRESVIQVALAAGYGTPGSFCRAFRQVVGVAPSTFQRGSQPMPAWSGVVRYDPATGAVALHLQPGVNVMQVRVDTLPDQWAVCLHHQGPYHEVGTCFQRLHRWVAERGLSEEEARFFGLSHDDPDVTPAAELRYTACVAVDGPVAVAAPFELKQIPGGRYGFYELQGHYEKIEGAFRQLFGEWLPESGYEADDRPCMEVYLNDCEALAPEEWRTELGVALR